MADLKGFSMPTVPKCDEVSTPRHFSVFVALRTRSVGSVLSRSRQFRLDYWQGPTGEFRENRKDQTPLRVTREKFPF